MCLVAAVALAPAWEAAAQTAPLPAGIEEVLVTARKKEERLQETPISVTAFTAATIERTGSTDMVDIASRTPNLHFTATTDLKFSPISLRGIQGEEGSAGAEPAVGIYIDEVFVGQGPGASLDLYDIERVEVLRGPQGTLFGRNTIGGVISVTTKRPSDTFEASISSEFGNKNYRRVGASVSGPLVDGKVAGKVAVIYNERGGYERNVWLNRDVNDAGSLTVRGQLLFKFSDTTDLLLTYEHQNVHDEPLVYDVLRYNEDGLVPQLLDARGLPRNTNPSDRKVYADRVTKETLRLNGVSATFRTRIGDVGITNVASYRAHKYFSLADTDRSPLSILYDGDPEDVWRASEELRADFSTGPVDWIGGVYYYRQRGDNESYVELGRDLADVLGIPELTGTKTGSSGKLDTTSTAAFLSATWHATDKLDFTVGGRYTRDRKKIKYLQDDSLGLFGGNINLSASNSWSEFTPNFNVRYRFMPDLMAYVTVSQGFKSGGYNDGLGSANGIAFDPERLWNYEAGVKSSWFDRRLTANLALFYMKWDNIQIQGQDPRSPTFAPITINGGGARSQGIELELVGRVTPALTLGFTGAALDAKYDKGTTPGGIPLHTMPDAPVYSANFNAEYRIPVALGEVSIFGEYVMRGRTSLSGIDPDGVVRPYQLFNMRVSLEAPDGTWRVGLWGKNLTDTMYMTRIYNLFNESVIGEKFVSYNTPRTFGVNVKYKF